MCVLLKQIFAVAIWIAISRTVDYWHDYSDVLAGVSCILPHTYRHTHALSLSLSRNTRMGEFPRDILGLFTKSFDTTSILPQAPF